jgi:hypothetical protein
MLDLIGYTYKFTRLPINLEVLFTGITSVMASGFIDLAIETVN